MAPLIGRISHQLSDRVQQEIKTEMQYPFDQTMQQIVTAYDVLTGHERFKKVRALIGKTSHIPRWDFEQSRLFERTLYIGDRCKE